MKKILLAATILAVSACGGGGGGGSKSKAPTPTPTPTPALEGQLTLGAASFDIDGLGFKTASIDSTTKDGKFSFKDGETVTFSLGKNDLFSIKASKSINFSEALLKNIKLPTTADEITAVIEKRPGIAPSELHPLHKVSNTLKLLLVLDDDRDSSNGFDLSDWHKKLSNTAVNLNTHLDNNLEFRKVFKDKLIAPLAMDTAKPLVYLYKKLNKKISAKQISTITINNDDLRTTNDYSFSADGHLKQKTSLIHRISTSKDVSKTSEEYAYNAFGMEVSRATTRIRNMDTNSPSTIYDREVREFSRYLSDRGYRIQILNTSSSGSDLNNLTVRDETVSTYNKNKILTYKNTNTSLSTRSVSDSAYSYNSQGLLIKDKTISTKFKVTDGSLISKVTSISNTSHSTKESVSTLTEEQDSNNDGKINIQRKTISTFDNEKNILSRERLNTGLDNSITYHIKNSYAYDGLGNVKSETAEVDDNKDGTLDRTSNVINNNYSESGILTNVVQTSFNTASPAIATSNNYNYMFINEGKSKGLFKSKTKTEQRWESGTAIADRAAPFRIVTDNYEYDEQTGLLSAINGNQIYNGTENDRRRITFSYDNDSHLSQYKLTLRLDNTGGTERTVTYDITYSETNDGLSYLLNNQFFKQFNSIVSKTDYRTMFSTARLISNPNN